MNSMLGMAGIGSIGIFWNQFVGFFGRVRALFIVKAQFPDNADGYALLHYFRTTMKELNIGDKSYSWDTRFIRPLDRQGFVPCEKQGDIHIFTKGWRPISISVKRDKEGDTMGTTITFIRGMFSTKDLFVNATLAWDRVIHEHSSNKLKRFTIRKFFGKHSGKHDGAQHAAPKSAGYGDSNNQYIQSVLHYSQDDIGPRIENRPFERLAYSESVLEFEKEVRRWKNSEKWFKERGLPWRFGGGLYGPPGTGKTSMVRALAQDLDLPIHSYDLTAMSNEELVDFWEESVDAAPCIVLFEDMDRIFDQDKKIKGIDGKAPLTMDCLLNCIGGVQSADGILVMVTANDVSKLDSALGVPDGTGKSTRPGRLDRAVWFGELEEKGRLQIAKRILAGYESLIEQTVKDGAGETGAQFESRCCKLALESYWNDKTVGIT